MRYEQVALTTKQERQWDETRAALAWCCPGFTHVLNKMLVVGKNELAVFTEQLPAPAATDGSALIIKPSVFFIEFNLMERVFVCGHEICHCIWNHCGLALRLRLAGRVAYPDGTTLPYHHDIMNIAMDYVINDLLIEAGKEAGQTCGQFPKGCMHDPKIATKMDSVIDAYRRLYESLPKLPPPPGGKGGKGEPDAGNLPGKRFDEHLDPGTVEEKDPVQAASDRNEGDWQATIAEAANVARLQGKMPGTLDRWFKELLAPQVDWRERIRSTFSRRVGSGGYDWRKPDRRMIVRDIYCPSRSGHGCGTVVVAGDTSGSINDKEFDMFFAEMAGIMEDTRPKKLIIIWCDAAVKRVDECDEPADLNVIRCKGAPGRGGTDFRPVFEEIEDMGIEPSALIYLTDGEGTFPAHAPSYPVIWGSILPTSKYPFGDVVDIPHQAP